MSDLDRALSGVARRADYLHIPLTQSTEEDSWLVTYLDVITLLLVMFVVMLALSGGPSDTPGDQAELAVSEPVVAPALPSESLPNAADLFARRAQATIQAAGLTDDITVIAQPDGVRFRISNDILFASGDSVLSGKGERQLAQLVPLLADAEYQVTVAGHTDSLPIRTDRFPSNWELSSARSSRVVRLFDAAGVARNRMQAAGYADTRPLFRNDTEQGRSRNRRVEIILEYGSMIKEPMDQGASRR